MRSHPSNYDKTFFIYKEAVEQNRKIFRKVFVVEGYYGGVCGSSFYGR